MKTILKIDLTTYLIIILSLFCARFKDIIILFTILTYHELGHLFLHFGENRSFEFVTIEEDRRVDKCESEADKFASDSLIPENMWRESSEVRLNPYQIQKKYSESAL